MKKPFRSFTLALFYIFLSFIANFFIQSEVAGGMITGKNVILFSIFIFFLIALFRRFRFSLRQKCGFALYFFFFLFCCFLIFVLCHLLRLYLVGIFYDFFRNFYVDFFLFIPGILFFFGGEHALPLPSPSGGSNSGSWTSFDEQVLGEPFDESTSGGDEAGPSHQPDIVRNFSFEASLRSRVFTLEKAGTLFLFEKEAGLYWNEVKATLDQAPSQIEYNRLLEFENRDLRIRELKHACLIRFQQVLSENPHLTEGAPCNPQENLMDFFDAKWAELEAGTEALRGIPGGVAVRDQRELTFLSTLEQNLRERGPNSPYVREILSNR